MTNDAFLSRQEAAIYLLEQYGTPGAVTAKTLAKLAFTGGGPMFHRFGRNVGYTKHALKEWVESRCSAPLKSTSDNGEVANEWA